MSDNMSDKFPGLLNATAQYALVRSAYEGGSDPKKLLGGLTAKKWGSINGDVKKKHFPFRKGRSIFSDIELPPKIAR